MITREELDRAQEAYNSMYNEGIIDKKDYHLLTRNITIKIQELEEENK